MLHVVFSRVKPEKEARLRDWLKELGERADEVRETFRDETVRHEQAFLIQTSDGPMLVYVMEAADFERGRQAYLDSTHPIDAQHRQVLAECLEGTVAIEPLYDVALEETHGGDS
jgi:hypothetical protein